MEHNMEHTKNLYLYKSIKAQLTYSIIYKHLNKALYCSGEIYQSYGYDYIYQQLLYIYMMFYYHNYPKLLFMFNKSNNISIDIIVKKICNTNYSLSIMKTLTNPETKEKYYRLEDILYKPKNEYNNIVNYISSSNEIFEQFKSFHIPKDIASYNVIIKNSNINNPKLNRLLEYYYYISQLYINIIKPSSQYSIKLDNIMDDELLYYKHKQPDIKKRRMIILNDICYHPKLWNNCQNSSKTYQILGSFWKYKLSPYWKKIRDKYDNDDDFIEYVVDKYNDFDEKWQISEKEKSHQIKNISINFN